MEPKLRSQYHHILSFKYAFEGITAAIKEEPNLKFHLLVAILVVTSGIYFNVTKFEWVILIIAIGLVIALELTNTAIEAIVDSFTEEQHPKAKYAKDIAAAAVMVSAIATAIVGIIIFLPYLK